MDRPIQGEVELDVPLEPIDRLALATDPESESGRVRDLVRDEVPVAGRRLRLRAVGPVLRECPREVRLQDDVRLVRLPGGRVDVMSVAVVRAERVVAEGARPDVDGHAIRGVEQMAAADDLDRFLLERLIGRRIAEHRRWPGVDRRPSRPTVAGRTRSRDPSAAR